MKKLIFVFISILFMTSCDNINTKYFLIYDGKCETINAADDSTAYYNSWEKVEIARCVNSATEAAMPNLFGRTYHNYDFTLWKITYSDSFKKKIENDLKHNDDIFDIIKEYIREDNKNNTSLCEKYKLSLDDVYYNISEEHMNFIFNILYERENSEYNKLYNKLTKTDE